MWADFDDAEAPGEVIGLIETSGLGPVDAVSFNAFCYGYYRAIQKIKEAVRKPVPLKTQFNFARRKF
jgi:hypothetical protein